MKSLELVKRAFKIEKVERIPWIPFVGCHAGKLLGLTATEFLKSKEHIVNGVDKAIKLYKADGIPVIFDLQIDWHCICLERIFL